MKDSTSLPADIAKAVMDEIDDELDKLTWHDKPMSKDLDIALAEIDSRSIRLQGAVFTRWLDLWLVHTGEKPLSENSKKLLFDEKTATMTRMLLKRHRAGKTPINQASIAESVYDKDKISFRVTASKRFTKLRPAIKASGLWRVEEYDGGKTELCIWPSDCLLEFHTHIFRAYRLKTIAAFVKLHQNALKPYL